LPTLEPFEIESHCGEIVRDVRHLVEKYLAVFDWDAPDIDQAAADGLILTEVEPSWSFEDKGPTAWTTPTRPSV
jgi:hypothetical protein